MRLLCKRKILIKFGNIKEIKEELNLKHIKTIIFDNIIPIIWILGVLSYATLLLVGNRKISKNIRNNKCKDTRVNTILDNCKNEIGIQRNIEIILQEAKRIPSIIGLLKPKILITNEFLKNNDGTIRYIFMHELSHYKRNDLLLNYVLLIVTAIHWFNPFIWLFFKKIRQDIELATDELVISYLKKDEQKAYGLTLINTLQILQEEKYAARLLCVTDDSKNMERRIKMIKLSDRFNKNKILISIISLVIIIGILGIFFVGNKQEKSYNVEETENVNSSELSKCEYKSFKPTFKLSEDSIYDDYDFSQDMEWKDKIYHKKIDNYEEYMKIKARWKDILDMSEDDFINSFMVITAIENTDMLGLTVDNIETDENTLYISLILEGESIEEKGLSNSMEESEAYAEKMKTYENTCISYVIPRAMERENIVCVRNLKDEEKDFDKEMKIGDPIDSVDTYYHPYQYRTEEYRKRVESLSRPDSKIHPIEPGWQDMMFEKFTITKQMPDINFENWNNLGNDFYSLEITDFSEYAKLINNYNVKDMSWYNFKYIHAIVIVRANTDYSIGIGDITTDEKGKSYLEVYPNGLLDVTEDFRYPGAIVFVPNYRTLEDENLKIVLSHTSEEISNRIFDEPNVAVSNSNTEPGTTVFKSFNVFESPDTQLRDFSFSNGVYYKKIISYNEYLKYKGIWSEMRELTQEDFINYYLIIAIKSSEVSDNVLTCKSVLVEDEKLNLYITSKSLNLDASDWQDVYATGISVVIPNRMDFTEDKINIILD